MKSRPLLKTRFRPVPGRPDGGDHWAGGEPRHRGASCPTCRIPLLLLWDINARDPRLPAGAFGPLDRVPLYFCWGCVADLAYRVTPDGGVTVARTGADRPGPHYPYRPYPTAFDRRPLALDVGVPGDAAAALARWDTRADPMGRAVPESDRRALAAYLGHPVTAAACLFHSQFGGTPSNAGWETEAFRCPNAECRGLLGRRRMRFVAAVLNDPFGGLPMVEPAGEVTPAWWNFFVAVQFHICRGCWTLHGCNRSS